MKKIFNLLAGILLSFNLWADGASMGDGTGLFWEFAKGTLTITYDGSGTGIMPDYTVSSNHAPWYDAHCTSFTSIVLPAGLKTIGNLAFRGCSSFQSISIPASVTSIGNSAFSGCSSLKSVTIHATTPPTLGSNVFDECHDDLKIYVPDAQAQLYANTWQDLAGKLYQITSGDPAPAPHGEGNCGTNLTWDYTGGELTFSGSGAMSDYTSETQPWAVFAERITLVELPEGLTGIGEYAFYNLEALENITLPSSLQSIGSNAFNNCYNFTSITCEAITPPTLGVEAFNYINKSRITLYVPAESIDAYKAADQWKDFSNIQAIGDIPSAIENPVDSSDARNSSVNKRLINGQLYILRDGKTYNALGVAL